MKRRVKSANRSMIRLHCDSSRVRNRVLIVDAYNVLNEWPHLAELFDAGNLESARDGLIEELKGYAHFKGVFLATGGMCWES